MANKAKHAFGNLADVQAALDTGKIDAYDILFLDGDTDPKVGWIDKNGVFRLVDDNTDLSELEAELATKADATEIAELEAEIATKVDAATVKIMIDEAAANVIEVVEF